MMMGYFDSDVHIMDLPDLEAAQPADVLGMLHGQALTIEQELSGHCGFRVETPRTEVSPSVHVQPQPTCSVSTDFHSEFVVGGQIPDTLFVTSDHVLFYAHSSHLIFASQNAFNSAFVFHTTRTTGEVYLIIAVPEHSMLFNIIIHTFYRMSCTQYNPPLSALLEAIGVLKKYGASLHHLVSPGAPLYDHIVMQMPRQPLDVYIVAAENQLEDLAVVTSGHLLSLHLPTITDEMADRIGSIYLKRLIDLHEERSGGLKKLLHDPPSPHENRVECGFVGHRKLARGWALAAASLVWDIRPDLSASVLRSAFDLLQEELECDACKTLLNTKVRYLILEWSVSMRRTI